MFMNDPTLSDSSFSTFFIPQNPLSSSPSDSPISWKCHKYTQNTSSSIQEENNQIAITMDNQYITLFSETIMKDSDSSRFKIFDTKNKTCQDLNVLIEQSQDVNRCIACYWKNGQIIVFGWNKNEGYLAIISLTNNQEEGMRVTYKGIIQSIKTSGDSHTMHIYQDRLYIVTTSESVEPFESSSLQVFAVNLETFQYEEIIHIDSKASILSHQSFLLNNKLDIYYKTQDYYKLQIDLSKPHLLLCILCISSLLQGTLQYQESPAKDLSLLVKPEIQTLQVKENIFAFAHFHEPACYKYLYIYNIETSQSSEYSIPDPCPNFSVRGNLTSIAEKIYVIGYNNEQNQHQIWSLSFKDGKIPINSSNSMTIEQLDQESLSLELLMKQLLIEVPYSDVTFTVENQQIPAHKWWLMRKSKYFDKMFSSNFLCCFCVLKNWIEGIMKNQDSNVTLPDIKASTFKAFLEFIYIDKTDLNPQLAVELLELGQKYTVPDLKKFCEEYLSGYITEDNYVQMANLAEFHHANLLRNSLAEFIAKNVKTLKQKPGFTDLPNNLLKDAIFKLAKK